MDQNKLKCMCGETFTQNDFTKHFGGCQQFKAEFKEFDSKFGELLKAYSEPKEKLLIVRFLLKLYITVIEKKLKKYYDSINRENPGGVNNMNPPPVHFPNPANENNNNMNNNSNNNASQFSNASNIMQQGILNQGRPPQQMGFSNPINQPGNVNPPGIVQNPWQKKSGNESNPNPNPNSYPNFNNNPGEINQKVNINQNPPKNDFDDDFEPQPEAKEDDNSNLCQVCKINPNILYLECVHPICYDCFEKEAKKDLFEMKCKICNKQISDQLKKDVLQDKFEQLEKIALMKVLGGDLVKCPYPDCGEQNVFEPGNVDYNVKDASGKLLSRQAAENYAKNRCRCGFCRRDFCKQCGLMPYHLGKTCEEYKHHEQAKKCRFCDTEIKGNNMGPDDDVCNSSDCRERYRISCKKKLRCGHKCFGVNGERNCPPCLDKECKQYGGQFDQDKDAYCPICYTEGLGSSPIVVTSCGHYMHYQCIKKRLETKWIGPKITFNHCLCPSCNKWFDIDNVPELQKMINENKKLYESIKEMALKRLKFEDLDKDPRLTDPKSPWFGKKVEFAMKRLSYYMCFVCKKPYFAGRRECGNDPNMNNDDPNKNYNPADCVCGKDANLSGVAGKTNCPKHGKDFIEYKCKFCCKIASWFCWGTTHFCEDCHKRQCNGDYISKYPKERLPKCNKSTCEVGGNHPPNGEEYALGCSICRNNAENDKGF